MIRYIVAVIAVSVVFAGALCGEASERPDGGAAPTEKPWEDVETIYSGVATSRAVLEVEGVVVVTSDGAVVTRLSVPVTLAADADPLHLAFSGIAVSYFDDDAFVPSAAFTATETSGDGDGILEAGEGAEIAIDPPACAECNLAAGDQFTIEIKPNAGSFLVIQRTLPASLAAGTIALP